MRIDVIDPDRAAELAELMNRNGDLEYGRFTPQLVYRRLWQYPWMSSATRLGAFDGDRLVAAIAGGVKPDHGFIRLFAVEAAYRRRGLGSRLLEELERCLRCQGAGQIVALYASPGYFAPGLDPRYTAALSLLHKYGYDRTDVVVNMIVPLRAGREFASAADRAEQRILQHGVRVRRAEYADRPQMAAWMAEHFPGGWGLEVDVAFTFDPIPLWIAFRNATIVGFAVYDVNMFSGGFGPTGVDESLRGLGIGTALFLRTLADMQARGDAECEIAWVGPIEFYSRIADARINRVYWQMQKNLS